MKARLVRSIFSALVLSSFVSIPRCSAQDVPDRDHWGEKFNSSGAQLTYKEVQRTTIQGRTVITYNLFATGLPKNMRYELCVLNVGGEPTAAADAFLNNGGKVVNTLADPAHHVAEDPIDLKAFGGKGEPIQVALISEDNQSRAFAQIVPFPIEATAGPCHITVIETGPYYFGVLIKVMGLQPNEDLVIDSKSENEGGETKAKADEAGRYNAAIFPFVKGKSSGKARFDVTAKSCKIGIEFPWGDGSYQYQ
jgi:hypothetical protein